MYDPRYIVTKKHRFGIAGKQERLMNKKLRMTVDILMVVLLPMLMAYTLIGEKFHVETKRISHLLSSVENGTQRFYRIVLQSIDFGEGVQLRDRAKISLF